MNLLDDTLDAKVRAALREYDDKGRLDEVAELSGIVGSTPALRRVMESQDAIPIMLRNILANTSWSLKMEEIKNGGPAFPTQGWEYDGQGNVLQFQFGGATLRDYFAAKAMQGDWAGNAGNIELAVSAERLQRNAVLYYRMADAMLAAREN